MGKLISRIERENRQTIVANLRERIEGAYPNVSLSEAYTRLGRDAGGISFSTVQRIMKGTTGANTDTLSKLSVALGCTLHDLTAPRVDPVRRERVRVYVDRPVPTIPTK
jgi:helix-turn-helix protein